MTRHETKTPILLCALLGCVATFGCGIDDLFPDGDEGGDDEEDGSGDDDDGSNTRGSHGSHGDDDGGGTGEGGDAGDGEAGDDSATSAPDDAEDTGGGDEADVTGGDPGDDGGGELVCGGLLDPSLEDACEQCLVGSCCAEFTECGEDPSCNDCLAWILDDPENAPQECYDATGFVFDCVFGPCGADCG